MTTSLSRITLLLRTPLLRTQLLRAALLHKTALRKAALRTVVWLPALVLAHTVMAQNDVVTFESTITGSQEQPKVIYIVPWQPPQAPSDMRKPISNLVMQDLLEPIDRDTFLRQVQYRAVLNERATAAKPAQ